MQIVSSRKITSIAYLLLCCFLQSYAQPNLMTRGAVGVAGGRVDTLKGTAYAIIMGISKYQNIPSLKFADEDAKLFSYFLLSPAGGSLRSEHIKLLLNDSARKDNFLTGAYGWLKNNALKSGDRLYLYFSGHGDADEASYYFLTNDCTPAKDNKNYSNTGAIDIDYIKKYFIKPQIAKGVEVILIMDACRTNDLPGGKEGQLSFANNLNTEERLGQIMLFATGPGQVSIESPNIFNGHGLFTFYLIDGLAGAADKNEFTGNQNGEVSLSEIDSYVKNVVRKKAAADFGTTQQPVICCSEQYGNILARVDSITYMAWQKKLNADQNPFAFNTKSERSVGLGIKADTAQINLYNRFLESAKDVRQIANGMAEQLYKDLENKWPGNPLTEEARFTLATSYLNFCQEKMNFFLNGKGMVHVINLEKESGLDGTAGTKSKALTGTNKEEITKLKTIVSTDYIKAAALMKSAISLLKKEPELVQAYLTRYEFLNCMALYAQQSGNLNEVLELCNHYISIAPGSPAGYLLKGWILKDMESDSCIFFFKKAASIAPKWPYPVNGLGNYYLAESKYDSALSYFNRAIVLYSLNSDAYRSRGLVHFIKGGYAGNGGMSRMDQDELELARKDFVQARNLNPSDTYAYLYFADHQSLFMQAYSKGNPSYSSYYNNARNNYLKAISIDTGFALGYKKLSDFYIMTGDTLSGLSPLQNFVQHNPLSGEGFRYLGNFYMNILGDSIKAEENFKKSIQLTPGSSPNYFALVKLYKKLHKKDNAIEVLNNARQHLFNSKDVYNELGNVYLLEPSQYELASAAFQKALEIDSTLDYVYYNLSVLYNAKNGYTRASTNNETSINYYRKAVQFNPYRWQKLNHQIAEWYYAQQNNLLAKDYYQRALAGGNLTKEKDIHQLVSILLSEKNYTEATKMVNLYLPSNQDKPLYSQLMGEINAAAANH